jgi:hypothetical protein
VSSTASAARTRSALDSARGTDPNAFTVAVLSIAATLIALYDLGILVLSLH